mgnify:FL=1
MIEIKNSLYNSKERKKQNKFNRYIQLKGKIRLKLKKFFPLSENEKIIYEHKYYEKEISKPLDGRYLEYNKRIHLLSVIPKSELNNFYLNYMNLVKKNPSKNSFSRRIVDDRVKNAILSFRNSYGGWTVLNEITPQSTDLSNIVDYITMYMFNLSDDYVGISFIITLNSNFNIELNKAIIGILSSISIKYYNDLYVNKDIKSTFNYQKSRYKYLYNKNKKIDQEFNNYIATKSSKDSLHLSKVSIWIAIISLIVTMLFSILSYVDSKKEENIPIVIFLAKKLDKTCWKI